MKKQYGLALKEFLKGRDYTEASSDLKRMYGESKSWDDFLTDARFIGFNWSQIYFVENLLGCYSCKNVEYLRWLILHILYQYEVGNLRTPIQSIGKDILEWFPLENPPINLEELLKAIPKIVEENVEIFGKDREPFLIKGDFIYINRIEKYEESFLDLLDRRLSVKSEISVDIAGVKGHLEKFMDYPLDGQRLEAVEKALKSNFLIISGGPGTGKTTTVVSIIRALCFSGVKNISLAAPTGRAAKRMIESINREKREADTDMPAEAYTLHKLLGIIPNRDRPRYHRDRQIPAEAVIVDEASMVDIHMMYRLFDALNENTKLILVGDKDQLPSVEAGALLGDFLYNYNVPSHKMNNSIVVLEKSYRSIKGIMDGAKLVISGDENKLLSYLKGDVKEIDTRNLPVVDELVMDIINRYKTEDLPQNFFIPVSKYEEVIEDLESYFHLFEGYTVLTPSKKGLFGTYSLNNMVKKHFNPGYKPFYHGEPIMITRNDYINGLFNGDRGIVFSFTNGLYAFFRENDSFKIVSISKIIDYETAYVGTVHKSQGSEFDSVSIVIPEGSEKLLTREILYTALTRAKKHVTLYAMDDEIKTAVKRRIIRHSGIREFLQ